MAKGAWSKELRSWYLYDAANSFLTINVSLYFSTWLILDQQMPDLWLSLSFMISTALLMFASPYVGMLGDRRGWHGRIFLYSSLLTILFGALIWGAAVSGGTAKVVLALVAYGLALFFLQLAYVPYGAFMRSLSPKSSYGKVSGIGYAIGQAGNILGLALTIPLAYGIWKFDNGRIDAVIVGAIACAILMLPALFILSRLTLPRDTRLRPNVYKSLWRGVRECKKHKGVGPLLLSFYFFSDALQSLFLFAAVYLEKVYHASDTAKAYLIGTVLIGQLVGAAAAGPLADRFGHRRTLIVAIGVSIITMILMAVLTTMGHIIALYIAFGLSIGAVYASSRSYLAKLIPRKEAGTFFGIYALSERFASIIGPAVWGIIIWLLRDSAPWNYRIAILAMAAFAAAGMIPLFSKESRAANC